MAHSAKAVANYFLDLAQAENRTLCPMKLQKLVYYAQGWHLGITGDPLIDEQVEAWDYGPVVRSLYGEFAKFGRSSITEKATQIDFSGDEVRWREYRLEDEADDNLKVTRELLKKVWNVYKKYSATRLSQMTHQEGTPWREVYDQHNGHLPKGTDIPMKKIEDHFKKRVTSE